MNISEKEGKEVPPKRPHVYVGGVTNTSYKVFPRAEGQLQMIKKYEAYSYMNEKDKHL